jgi:hypothetical protein
VDNCGVEKNIDPVFEEAARVSITGIQDELQAGETFQL